MSIDTIVNMITAYVAANPGTSMVAFFVALFVLSFAKANS